MNYVFKKKAQKFYQKILKANSTVDDFKSKMLCYFLVLLILSNKTFKPFLIHFKSRLYDTKEHELVTIQLHNAKEISENQNLTF